MAKDAELSQADSEAARLGTRALAASFPGAFGPRADSLGAWLCGSWSGAFSAKRMAGTGGFESGLNGNGAFMVMAGLFSLGGGAAKLAQVFDDGRRFSG